MEISSTNDYAKRLTRRGEKEGALVIADHQRQGRGRQRRKWYSQPGKGLCISIILRPVLATEKLGLISLLAGVVIAQTVEKLSQLNPTLKWPNDVMLQSRKLSGILIESDFKGGRLTSIVVGIGININHDESDFHSTIRSKSTSLYLVSKKITSRVDFMVAFLNQFEEIYHHIEKENYEYIISEWLRRCPKFKKPIRIQIEDRTISGVFHNIDGNGWLILKQKNAQPITVKTGEVC
ncbi:MAG: biotin--[acetyl-CoA-carboxylase] ligase [bacterium]